MTKDQKHSLPKAALLVVLGLGSALPAQGEPAFSGNPFGNATLDSTDAGTDAGDHASGSTEGAGPRAINEKLNCPSPMITMQAYDKGEGGYSWADAAAKWDGTVEYRCLTETGSGGSATDPVAFERMLQAPKSELNVGSRDAMISSCMGANSGSDFQTKMKAMGVTADYHIAMKRMELGAKGALESIGAIDAVLGEPMLKGVPKGGGHLPDLDRWHEQISKCPRSAIRNKLDANGNPVTLPRGGRFSGQNVKDYPSQLKVTVESMIGNLKALRSAALGYNDASGDGQALNSLMPGYEQRAKDTMYNEGRWGIDLWANPQDIKRRALQMIMADAKTAAAQPETRKMIADHQKLTNDLVNAQELGDLDKMGEIQRQMAAIQDNTQFKLAANVFKRVTPDGLTGTINCAPPSQGPNRGSPRRGNPGSPPRIGPSVSAASTNEPAFVQACANFDFQRGAALANSPLLKEVKNLKIFRDADFKGDKPDANNIDVARIDELLAHPEKIYSEVTGHLRDKRKQIVEAHGKMLKGAACLNGSTCDTGMIDWDKSLSQYLEVQEALKYTPKIDLGPESTMAEHFAPDRDGKMAWLREAQCRQETRIKAEKTNDFVAEAGISIGLFAVTLGVGSTAILLTQAGRTAVTAARGAAYVARAEKVAAVARGMGVMNDVDKAAHAARLARIAKMGKDGNAMIRHGKQIKVLSQYADMADGVYALPAAAASLRHCQDLGIEVNQPADNQPACSMIPSNGVTVEETKDQKIRKCLTDAGLNMLPVLQGIGLYKRFFGQKPPTNGTGAHVPPASATPPPGTAGTASPPPSGAGPVPPPSGGAGSVPPPSGGAGAAPPPSGGAGAVPPSGSAAGNTPPPPPPRGASNAAPPPGASNAAPPPGASNAAPPISDAQAWTDIRARIAATPGLSSSGTAAPWRNRVKAESAQYSRKSSTLGEDAALLGNPSVNLEDLKS